ncbi:leucine-rich repeat protein [Enterococcus thailandicus]|uniref:leucine-rich repeat protein n=1 Tax=Enterococcus thailandicus TaxID=417368 RepID=UPI0022EBC1B8|nr:leucine-rich repeat protein [Enterococcus thailandicus]MDA3973922.1 leucine-rich repeat protein [Enterococcus thailandicus]MDA3976267.1 leucine-rich repeat protein [Enterococcus thailandicus]MDA3981232.1 leucine-rich repeat protein [Enterococcus thailandicus]
MQQKTWRKFAVPCMVLALMMPSIVQATEIVATSEAEVSTDKMAEETSEKTEVSSEKLSVKDENLQAEPVVQENVTTVMYDEVEFELNHTDDTARVVAYHGTGGHVNIPATVFWNNWDFYVTRIGEGAFLSKEITSVSLGPYIQSISNFAFNDNQLTSISFPNSLIWIGHSAFAYNQLTSVVIPDSVTTIQYAAFFNNQLESVHLGRGISSLDASVLGENNLLELNIPSSITTVGAHAFQDNPLYYLNTEVEHIETLRYALDQTSMNLVLNRTILRALDYVAGTEREVETIPGENIKFQLSKQYRLRSTADRVWEEYIPTVQWFKNDASLSGETNLLLQLGSVTPEDSGVYHAVVDGVRFPDLTLEVIDESIEQSEFEFEFSGTDGNSTATLIGYNGAGGDVVIPSETVNREAGWESSSPVTVIGSSAFYGKQLTNVNIPDGVTSLGAFAFYDNQLTNVELPDTITNMGSYAFANNRITHVNIPKNLTVLEDHVFLGNNLTNVTLPEGIISIGNNAFALNELTDIYIPDSVRSFGAGVFRGSPLRYIETNRDNLLNLRMIIDPAVVLTNVTETTVLRALEYTEETEINSEVVIGSHVHYQISNQYIIGVLGWMVHLPTVYWFKDDIQIADQTGKGIVIQDLQESDSGIYKAIVDGTPFPDLQLEVIPEIEPEIPAIDPSEPPASPENVNPDVAGLSIRYASDIHFKSAPFSISDQDLFLDSQENQPMVTIQDMRPKSERSGWELLVSQDTSFMNGAEIVMNPFIHQANQDNLLIDPSSELVLNDAPQRFAGTTTNQSNPFGIVSMGMESEGKPMRLRVPEKTGIGSYETTVHWQLVTGP